MRSAGWDRDLRCAAHQLASRILSVFYKHDDAGYRAGLEIFGRLPMAPMPYRDPGCVASGARTLVLGGAAVALFMTDRKRAAVADDVFHRAKYPCAFARHAFPECRRIGQTGDARYRAAAMGAGRASGQRLGS